MLSGIAARVGRSAAVVLLVTVMVVALLELVPGSVAHAILGEGATPENVAALEKQLGTNEPFLIRYWNWLSEALQGNLGTSPLTGQDVWSAIAERAPVTLQIAIGGLLIALVVSLVLAVLAASFPNSWIDQAIGSLTTLFLSVPAFVAGPVLIYLLALQLGWLPVAGYVPLSEGFGPHVESLVLPCITVALAEIAAFQRLLRADLLATLDEEYVSAARAKGLGKRYVMFRHALRPSAFSLVTIAGISLGRLIGGTVIVEVLFSLPGLGQLVFNSITSRDIVTVQGAIAFIAIGYVLVNALVDGAYGLLDPRVRKVANA